jgi:hypothetical protein
MVNSFGLMVIGMRENLRIFLEKGKVHNFKLMGIGMWENGRKI